MGCLESGTWTATFDFGPRTIQKGNKHNTTKEILRAYCPNRYTVTAANAVSLVRKKKFFYSQTLGHA